MPIVIQLTKAVMPILVKFVSLFAQLIEPLVPVLSQIADIIGIILPPVAAFLELVLKIIIEIVKGGANLIGEVLGIFTKPMSKEDLAKSAMASAGGSMAATAPKGSSLGMLPAYANGGFATTPSLFGDAGLEAAIPIRPGNRRSLDLLDKTAQLLGVGKGFSLTYAPSIQNGDPAVLEPMLKQHSLELEGMLEDFFGRRGRLSFG